MVRKPLDKEAEQLLKEKETDLRNYIEDHRRLGLAIENVKKSLVELNNQYEFPDKLENSEIWGNVRITYPRGNYRVDFKKFIEVYGIDVFLKCFTIEKATMNVDKFTEMAKNEEVVESRLRECIIDPRELGPRVHLAKEGDEAQD